MQGVAYHKVLQGGVPVAIHGEKDTAIEGVPDAPDPVAVVGAPGDEGEAEVSGLREGACSWGGPVQEYSTILKSYSTPRTGGGWREQKRRRKPRLQAARRNEEQTAEARARSAAS